MADEEPLSAEELAALERTADWIGFAIEPYDNTGPVTMASADARRIAEMAVAAKRLLATVRAREAEIALLRQRLDDARDAHIADLKAAVAKP